MVKPLHAALDVTLPDGRHYPIYIANDLLKTSGPLIAELQGQRRVIIITDQNVAERCLPALQASLSHAEIPFHTLTLMPGEGSKSFAVLEETLTQLLSLAPDRQTMLIALGGGVVGDLTGFAASILLRGVPFVQIPTTLLSQVDSAVGGKTGINTAHGKNLIGSFHQPQAVIIDTQSLATLPPRELRAGFAEIVKAAAIADADFFSWLEENLDGFLTKQPAILAEMITRSLRIKADIVMRDEREGGIRALLNLGHTFGHALEAECQYDGRLIHGEAVALGTILAFDYAATLGLCRADDAQRVRRLFQHVSLPTQCSQIAAFNAAKLVQHMQHDKKPNQGEITLILPRSIGQCEIHPHISADSLQRFWEDALTSKAAH